MTNGTSPVTVYEVTCKLQGERGMGFSIKRAVEAGLKRHRINGKIGDFDASSNNLRLTIEVYSQEQDQTPGLIKDYTLKSGQLPKHIDLEAQGFAIRQLTHAEINADVENAKIGGLETEITGLQQKISDLTARNEELAKVTGARKIALEKATAEADDLRKQIERKPGQIYEDPLRALIFNFLSGTSDELLEAFLEASDLQAQNDLEQLYPPKMLNFQNM